MFHPKIREVSRIGWLATLDLPTHISVGLRSNFKSHTGLGEDVPHLANGPADRGPEHPSDSCSPYHMRFQTTSAVNTQLATLPWTLLTYTILLWAALNYDHFYPDSLVPFKAVLIGKLVD